MGLSAKGVANLKKPGRYGDGHGLCLQITPSGVKSWLLRYERNGRERWMAIVDTGLVLKCIEEIWKTKPEAASRVRGRIEAVLDWASVRGYRTGDNPARWHGLISEVLPARGKAQKTVHHAALTFTDLAAF